MRSYVASSPPTMIESRPSSSVEIEPETGASTMSAPAARVFSASSRLTAGATVDMSTQTPPGARPARMPSGPSATARTAATFVTMEKTTSPAAAAARGLGSRIRPSSTSVTAFSFVRL